jgi:D-alanyl-D-alanine carboxypeptidase/D-alanyl-D-alanine-endopeptidase (penicillin-binding protein 4)
MYVFRHRHYSHRLLSPIIAAFTTLSLMPIVYAVPSIKSPGIPDDVPADIKQLLNAPALSGCISGIMIADTTDGSIFYARNEDIRLIPASNRKLFTSAAALEILGDSFTIPTIVSADAKPDLTGVINGNLYIKGGGDALLSLDNLKQFVVDLQAAGVKEISGDIVGDTSLFTDGPYPDGWGVDYLSDDYAAQIAALEVNEGVIGVNVAPATAAGAPPLVTLTPSTDYIPVVNTAATIGPDGTTNLLIQRPYNKNEIDVTGTIKLVDSPQAINITVDNPALYCATILFQDLTAAGIKVDGKSELGVAPASATKLTEHDSVPLSDYILLMNKPSDNLQAESLVRLLGALKGTGGSLAAGNIVENGFYASCGITPDELVFADGSGVTRLDQVSAHAVVKLLLAMASKPDFKAYYDSLPIAGIDGTLKHRMIGTPAAGNVHAKTGTVRYCHCLSGYVTNKSGHLLAFSILNNNFLCTDDQVNQIQDAIMNKLVEVK